MVLMQWKTDAAGRLAAQWAGESPKKARHHKTVKTAAKARLRRTWR